MPQLSLFPLQYSLQCDFGMTAAVSSGLLDQADLPRQYLHNLSVVGRDELSMLSDFSRRA